MLILPRYLFRLLLPVFLLCAAVCTGVLVMNHFMRLFNVAVMKGVSPFWILSCFAGLLPYFLALAIPMAFLVSLLLTLGALSERGEVMALRSSGFSFAEILWPFLVLAAVLSAALLYVDHKASPEGFHSFRNRYFDALAQVSRLDLEAGAFTSLGDWKLYAQSIDKRTQAMKGVYLIRLRGEHQGMRVEAPEGRVWVERGQGFWLELRHGALRMPEAEPSRFLSAGFDKYRIFLPFVRAAAARDLDLQELNTRSLRERLRNPALDASHRMEYTTEESLRSAAALTPFVFFWIGCPLGLRLERHTRATGFALSLLILFAYYGLLVVGIGLGRRHFALSAAGPWIPVAAGLAAGGWFWRRRLNS